MGPSIEQTLQSALQTILQEKIALQAASRTDAKVHARRQVVQFFTRKNLPVEALKYRLNQLLPKDIAVIEAIEVDKEFHPTLACRSKVYHYTVCFGKVQLPQYRHFSWHFPYPLDILLMQKAIPYFMGIHDFSSFCNSKKNATYKNKLCQIFHLEVELLAEDRLRVIIEGDRFLYKMARNIAGTLVYVGCGKIHLEEVADIIKSGSRPRAGITVPAHGLALFDQHFC